MWFGALLVWAMALFGQDSPEMMRAQQEIVKLRELVAAGAVAPARLADAERKLGDAQDDAILQRTLYGRLKVQDLTEEQSGEMVAAAERRFERQKEAIDRTQKLVDAGVLARGELSSLQEELESRQLTVDLAKSRAKLLEELAEQARREMAIESAGAGVSRGIQPRMQRFDGPMRWISHSMRDESAQTSDDRTRQLRNGRR